MIIAIISIVSIIICLLIGSSKQRAGFGLLMGLAFGPLGIIFSASAKTKAEVEHNKKLKDGSIRQCPYCMEWISSEAAICKNCSKNVAEYDSNQPEPLDEKIIKEIIKKIKGNPGLSISIIYETYPDTDVRSIENYLNNEFKKGSIRKTGDGSDAQLFKVG